MKERGGKKKEKTTWNYFVGKNTLTRFGKGQSKHFPKSLLKQLTLAASNNFTTLLTAKNKI